MARRQDPFRSDAGDDYTPATDLVFSLFAMTVLLLALFGASGQLDRQEVRGEVEEARDTVRKLEASNRDLQIRLSAVPAPRVFPRAEAPPAQPAQFRIATVSEAEVGPFMQDDTRFSPATLERLEWLIGREASMITGAGASRLLFEFSTSASRGAADDGTDMDMVETMNWAEAFLRAMRRSPLPVGCLAVMPLGKMRSAHLTSLVTQEGAGKALDDFDELLRLNQMPAAIAREIGQARANDRRITVWAQRLDYEGCAPSVLSAAVDTLSRRPNPTPP